MKTITTTPVESSQIDFPRKSGGVSRYQYSGVSPELFEEFKGAESIGSFFTSTSSRSPTSTPTRASRMRRRRGQRNGGFSQGHLCCDDLRNHRGLRHVLRGLQLLDRGQQASIQVHRGQRHVDAQHLGRRMHCQVIAGD